VRRQAPACVICMEDSGALDHIPATVGRYEIQTCIGVGAMGAVYKAFDPLIKRTLAIKTIRLDISRQSPQYQSFIERFYHEARISGTLSHPNIVTLFDIGESAGVPYLAMEFVDGDTLAGLIEQGLRFAPEEVVGLLGQVAAAVDHAHGKGVVHRDIKPSNLILFEADKVKVTDFGIAKMIDTKTTQQGQLLGTPSYMSPEQAMGEEVDARTDIFSLGVCAFEMISGEQPFPGSNVTAILYKLVHVDPVEPTDLEMSGVVPERWHEVFHKVLAKRPGDRFQTATDFVRALETCLRARGPGQVALPLQNKVPTHSDPDATRTLAAISAPALSPVTAEAAQQSTVLVPAAGAAAADDGATVKVPSHDAEETVLASLVDESEAPQAATVERTVAMEPATATMETPAEAPTRVAARPPVVSKRAGAARKPLPSSWIVGGLVALFVVALGTGLLLISGDEPAAPAAPVTTLAGAPGAGQQPVEPELAVATAALRITSEPSGAVVTINGEERGATPLLLADLPVGNYDVRITSQGHETFSELVAVTVDEPEVKFHAELDREAPVPGHVEFVSEPAGASVTVDGRTLGSTPLAAQRLSAGRHRVVVNKTGYQAWTDTITVVAGDQATVQARLRRAATPPPTRVAKVDPDRVYDNKRSQVDKLARKRSGRSASYPKRAPKLKSGQSVSVRVSLVVDADGKVAEAKVLESGGKKVDEAVLKAVRKWRYTPASKQGTPVKVRIVFRQTFRSG